MSAWLAKVKAGFRIHLGFYRFLDPPYIYGSLGAALQEPELTLTVIKQAHGHVVINTPTEESKRIIEETLECLDVRFSGKISVNGYVKHHVGLGTKTRIILSLLKGLQTLGVLNNDLLTLAREVGLGKFSGVGIYTFLHGGVVIDSGILEGLKDYPQLIHRFDTPERWRVVVVLPLIREGLSESQEAPIMRNPIPHPKQDLLYNHLKEVVEGLEKGDFELFSRGVESVQSLTGKYFSKFQGGVFCCEESARVAQHMKALGASGVGQSSWGPLIYGFTADPTGANRISINLRKILNDEGIKADIWVTRIPRKGFHVVKA
ncbi:MAG: hypothetical protein J7L55_02490 [Desulfurococcales archaeon]|nr:hypothetical protein [Desulfurococcales archaeon]